MIFKKEKEVIKLIEKYLDGVEKCVSTAENGVQHYLGGDTKRAKVLAQQTRSLESKADAIRYDIRDKLYSGAYLPAIREDIYRLIERIDKVANAGEACTGFFSNQRPQIPESLKAQFEEVVKESFEIVEVLKQAVLCFLSGDCGIETVRHYSEDVGIKESKVDKMEWDLTKAIFISPMDYSHKIHLRQCLDTIVEVSDRAEDAVEQLELASIKTVF